MSTVQCKSDRKYKSRWQIVFKLLNCSFDCLS